MENGKKMKISQNSLIFIDWKIDSIVKMSILTNAVYILCSPIKIPIRLFIGKETVLKLI